MNDNLAPQVNRRSTDAEHLNLLSMFHYVAAGLSFIGILVVVGHYWLFSRLMAETSTLHPQAPPPMPFDFSAMMKWVYVIIALFMVASAAVNLLSGLFMRSRQHRTFSIVVAAINCLHMPFGTALGVFTIVVLVRDSVRGLYAD